MKTLPLRKRGGRLNFLPCISLEVCILALAASTHITIAQTLSASLSGSNVMINWTNPGATLETAPMLPGPWHAIMGATNPYFILHTNPASFFRLNLSPVYVFDFLYGAPEFNSSIGNPVGCGCTSPENPNGTDGGGSAQDNALGNVYLHTGELTEQAVDLSIPGVGPDWRFERRYRSGMNYNGPLGFGWDFNYNRRLVIQTNGDALCVNGLGRVDRYPLNTNGSYTSPGGFYTQLKKNPDGTFSERDRHGGTNSYSMADSMGIARLMRMSDRNGNQLTFQYNSNGQLSNVMDTLSRPITYMYDANGRLTNVMDFAGRALRFAYDANSNLVSVTSPSVTGTPNGNDFPNGKTTMYSYSSGFSDTRFNHNLLSVTVANEVAVGGPPCLVAQYDTNPLSSNVDRLVSVQLGGTNVTGVGAGGTLYYTYVNFGPVGMSDFATPVFQNTVSNRNGNVTQYQFNQLGNIVRSIQFTRGLRAGDPPGFTNLYTYNGDGEMTGHTNPALGVVHFTFDSSNLDRFQEGNLLQTVWLPGPRGGDQTQIITSRTYDSNFNYVATSTDGHGNVTTYAYDAHGNRTNSVGRLSSVDYDYAYDGTGRMTSQTLPDNGSGHRRIDAMTYYLSGPQTGYLQSRVVDSGGLNLTTTYQWDAMGRLVRVVDPNGNDSSNIVNSLNQVVRRFSSSVNTLTGPVRYEQDFYYDANNNLVREDVQNRDYTGAVVGALPFFITTNKYDILNELLQKSEMATTNHNVATSYFYDPNGNLIFTQFGEATAGRQTNNTVTTVYDERDLVFLKTRAYKSPIQSTTQYNYDGNGNPITTLQGIEDLTGVRVNTIVYDGFDRRVNVVDPMGNDVTYHYDPNANLVSQQVNGELIDLPGSAGNTNLSASTFIYDVMDRRTMNIDSFFDVFTELSIGGGAATNITQYAPDGDVLVLINPNNHGRTNSYDGANRLSTVTDAKGNTLNYSYDADGNVIRQIQSDNSDLGNPSQSFTTTKYYDGRSRLISQSDNRTNTTQYAYDSRDNLAFVIDARTNSTLYTYDGLSRRIQTSLDMNKDGNFTDAADIVTSQIFDDDSRVTSLTDNSGNVTTSAYDGLGRRNLITHADGTTNSTSYDVHDNPIVVIDSNGSVMNNTFDLLDRLSRRSITVGSGVNNAITGEFLQYDGMSRLMLASNNVSLLTRHYDSLSDVIKESQQTLPTGTTGAVVSVFDPCRNLLTCTYPGGRVISNSYDALERVSAVSDAGGMIASNHYVGPFRAEQCDYGNGTRMLCQYDGATGTPFVANDFGVGLISRIIHTNASAGGVIDDRRFTYDQVGDKTTSTNSMRPENRLYTYDNDERMTGSAWPAEGKSFIYQYDGDNNRTLTVSNSTTTPYTLSPPDSKVDEYNAIGTDNRQYDKNGNLTQTSASNRNFGWDAFNQLQFFFNVSATAANQYDALGRRTVRISSAGTIRYFYDPLGNVAEEQSNNTTVATYVYNTGPVSDEEFLAAALISRQLNFADSAHNMWWALAIAKEFRKTLPVAMTRNGSNYTLHADDQGSIRAVTDRTGHAVEEYGYYDFGQPIFYNGSLILSNSAIGNLVLFGSQRYNPETGLYLQDNGQAPYYDPASGRFVSRITQGGWSPWTPEGNPYDFANNNPVSGSLASPSIGPERREPPVDSALHTFGGIDLDYGKVDYWYFNTDNNGPARGSGLFQDPGGKSSGTGTGTTPSATVAISHFGGETNNFTALTAQKWLAKSGCKQPGDASDLTHDVTGESSDSAAAAKADAISKATKVCEDNTSCSGTCSGGSDCKPWAVQYGQGEPYETGFFFTTYHYKFQVVCGCACDK